MMFVMLDDNIENGFSVFSVQPMSRLNDECNFNWKYFIMNKYCWPKFPVLTNNSQSSLLFWAENQLIPNISPFCCCYADNCKIVHSANVFIYWFNNSVKLLEIINFKTLQNTIMGLLSCSDYAARAGHDTKEQTKNEWSNSAKHERYER